MPSTRPLPKLNLTIRGIDAKITQGYSFHQDQHPVLNADFVIAKNASIRLSVDVSVLP